MLHIRKLKAQTLCVFVPQSEERKGDVGMKILYTTTIGGTMGFFKSFIEELKKDGHTIDIASNISVSPIPKCYEDWKMKVFPLSCSRSPLSKGNIKAYKILKKIINEGNYDLIHCHTPVGALLTRLAARKARKKGTKVLYTAHGFHFFKGAPLKNWLIYFPIEWFGSFFADGIITMNKEDYDVAQRRLHAKKTFFVHGVGVSKGKIIQSSVSKEEKFKELNIPKDALMLMSVGELSVRKNHQVILNAMAKMENKNVHYCIAGKGSKEEELLKLAQNLGLEKRFHLLGFRSDINELLACCDMFCFPSLQEGLPVSLMEAMAYGIPCVVSSIRGNTDLVTEGKGGYLCGAYNVDEFASKIDILCKNPSLRAEMGEYNKEVSKLYMEDCVNCEMKELYDDFLNN